MKIVGIISIFVIVVTISLIPVSFAHQSGCHRWHSCPSDSGSYTCGDTGYCSGCPDNQYCKAGQPYTSYTPPKYESPKEPVKVEPKEPTPVPKIESVPQTEIKSNVPSWIKNNAKWWSDGQIDDTTFVSGIKYLINEGTLKIPQTTQGTGTGSNQIPSWIKNNAGWWSDGSIDDSSFVQGIQYLIKEGILKVSVDKTKCIGKTLCITEKVTKIVDGDTIYTANQKIRLSLTNTPEKDQIGFNEATSFTANLCPVGSTVTIDQDDLQPYDVYGRLLGKVYCGDKILNSELLYSGHGVILKQYCGTSEFSEEIWAQKFGC